MSDLKLTIDHGTTAEHLSNASIPCLVVECRLRLADIIAPEE